MILFFNSRNNLVHGEYGQTGLTQKLDTQHVQNHVIENVDKYIGEGGGPKDHVESFATIKHDHNEKIH